MLFEINLEWVELLWLRSLFCWYTWNGKGFECLEFWDRITEMLTGTISVNDDMSLFYFYCVKPLSSFIRPCKSLILTDKIFFSFLSSLTSLVKLTVYLFSLTMIVFRMVSSILLSLFVLMTWSIRWSLLSTNTSTFWFFSSLYSKFYMASIFLTLSANINLELLSWKLSNIFEYISLPLYFLMKLVCLMFFCCSFRLDIYL